VAILTPLPLDVARDLVRSYGRDLIAIEPIVAGSVNSNFALTCASGERLFLRIFEEQTAATAHREATLLKHLAACRVPTPEPLSRVDRDEAALHEIAGKPVAVFPFVEGRSACQRALTASHLSAVGAALARVHSAGELARAVGILDEIVGDSRFDREALVARIDLARGHAEANDEVNRALDACEADLANAPAFQSETVIHGDLFRDNVLFNPSGGVTALLDFESASKGSVAFDIAVTLLAFSFGDALDLDLVRAFLSGYGEVRPIDDATRDGLFDACLFACTRFSVTRITDFELRPRGSVVYKDYRRFRARRDAIVALGNSGVQQLFPR
jgi:homoserine kinase type II